MKIEKIEIRTSNKKHATDIAMLVDKHEFLKEIQKLRKKWQITELYKHKRVLGNSLFLDTRNAIYHIGVSNDEAQLRVSEFNQDVEGILKTFNRGENFKSVVIYALIAGVIPEGVYQSCYFDIVTINQAEDLSKPEKYQYVIVISPRTEKQEVEKAYNEFVKHIKGKVDFHSPRISLDSEVTEEFHDAMKSIEREKKLYEKAVKNADSPEEVHTAITKYLVNTEKAREYLLRIGDLSTDIPDHKDLIEQYHKGNIYKSAIVNDGSRRDLERTREWYWMRFEDYFNGISAKPKTYGILVEEWHRKCPMYGAEDEKHIAKCRYCSIGDESNIEHALSPYYKLLN